ncbi:SRPBCC family protein [Streptacidiphilus sp. ASG 303]|uniref:SRPBCC family protein n=1 Tax=Streptomycetaceae TaxID=2062 RepID=UPI001E5C75C4|nr:SRPBCC family protein [Streptacidiphilus sp. ASG 303]MCD0483768.1 SRPBCC family protein [Streptacidiphilus sp. ASG 303]
MARRLRPGSADFLDAAPLRLVLTAVLAAPPEAVYRELAEVPEGWPAWFREVSSVAYADGPPCREGGRRRVGLVGGARFTETVTAAEPGRRFAYRVEETNVPGVLEMAEEWRLSPSPYGGTRLQWTTALDARRPAAALWGAARPLLGRAFRRAARRLDERLAAAAPR